MDQLLSDAEQLVDYLRRIRSMLKRMEEGDLPPTGLTSPQMGVLRELITTDGLSLKELSRRLGLAQSTVSGIVDRLEKRQMVHRRPDPTDNRINRVYLDPVVTNFANSAFYERRSSVLAQAMEGLPAAERNQIIESFQKVHLLLEEYLQRSQL